MSQNIQFLIGCFPHLERREIEKVVRQNSGKSVDQLCTILLSFKRKVSPSINESINLEPMQKKRKSNEEEEDDDDVKIIMTIPASNNNNNNNRRRRRKRKKKKKSPVVSSSRSGQSDRSKFLAQLHGSRMMSVNPPLFVGDGEDKDLKRQKEKFRMKKIHFESELHSVRRKHAHKWRNQGGRPTGGANPTSNQPLNNRRMMTLNTLPDAYDNIPTYPNLDSGGSVNTISGLGQRERDPKRIGVECLKHTNEYRKRKGLKELKWNEKLYEIAMTHSQRMGDKKCPFGHHGFNNRMNQMTKKCGASSGAENVAWTTSQQNVAKETVDGWISSPGHRKNMVSNQRFCSIAVYRNSEGRFYLTQLFCR